MWTFTIQVFRTSAAFMFTALHPFDLHYFTALGPVTMTALNWGIFVEQLGFHDLLNLIFVEVMAGGLGDDEHVNVSYILMQYNMIAI